MRLRPTLIGLLLVLTLVLSSTVYAGFALHKDAVVATQRSEVNETAERTARTLESRLDSKERVVRVGASANALGEHGTDRQQTALAAFLRKSEFDGASVVARNGTVLAFSSVAANASERDAVVGSDFSDRAYVKAALNGSTYVSEPFRASSGNYVVVVSAPIRNDTEVVGTLNAAFHLDPSASHLDPSESGRPALFANLDDLTGPMQTVRVERWNETLYGDGHVDGNTFDATDQVASTDWVVVVHGDRSEVQERLETVTLVQGGALLVVLFSVGTVGFWTYRTNIEQIAELRAGLTALEGGEYDVDVALTGTEEWDEIGERFERVGNRLEQRESQLRVLNRVLRHNLRNEMNVVLGHSQSVTEDDADVDVHAAAIESAARETLAISQHARMIEDRLKDATGTREPAAIDAVVDDALAAVTETALATVSVHVPAGVVVADGDALSTALAEVVGNAIVHNPAPPADCEVSVTATDRDATVRVTVTDNGPGLPDVERDLLTGELEASPVDHSEGLGLWIARWLVERADGSIDATVTDDGTTLTLHVPTVYTND
jgi:signal transduction histidine kinase